MTTATVLPPIAETPTLVVRFTAKATERLIGLCKHRWQEHGLVILEQHTLPHPAKNILLVLTATQQALEAQAERLHFMMPTTDGGHEKNEFGTGANGRTMEYFTRAERQRFLSRPRTQGTNNQQQQQQQLFNARDCAFLVDRIFRSVTVLDDIDSDGIKDSNPLSVVLETEYNADFRVRWLDVLDGTSCSMRSQHAETSDALWHVLTNLQLVDCITCIHQPTLSEQMVSRTTLAPLLQIITPPDIHFIQEYLGYEIGFYFAWIGFLTKWYTVPASIGLLVYALRLYRGDTIDEDEFVPFYGMVCFFWAILFLRFWERQEHRLAYQWGTYSLTNYERTKYFSTRPEFRGYLRKSPITDEYEPYYPPFRRRLKYVFSALVTIAMLAMAFGVMILSLNLQGYINPRRNPERWHHRNNPHPFHFPAWADLAEEGNIFDSKSPWRSLIPVVIHVLCISTLNSIYRMIAERLTHFENHQTELDHTNSLVVKRFLFEAFDCYVALFYLAFYERDVYRLRLELIGIFQIDTLRRVLLECLVPMLWQSYQQGHFILPKPPSDRKDPSFMQQQPVRRTASVKDILEELEKDEYEQFDDFMEIVIQLGYVSLFASAYPLASLVAIFANWAEIRTDAFKIARLCRRPSIHRSAGLGTWRTLIASIVWMSALTNCLITGFTSDQLMQYWPSFYKRDAAGYTDMGHDRGWIAVFCMFGLEHVLLIVGWLVTTMIPAVPEDVSDALERQQYLRVKRHDNLPKGEDKKTQ